ncbi:PAS domain-containing response regulator [Halobaculum rarum]|uniref:PAS domain-containing response regulator n=1 Tax=Halobaculum rarum TaxID=3075122 RepID=UPI0032AFBAAB
MSTLSLEDVTVLHVDDEPGFTDLVKNFLERADSALSIQEAANVDDALSILLSEDIDCIVSDYDMPGKDGLDFLELVRDEHPNLPFILFTGRGSEQIASEAISAGVTEYLQKEGGTDQYKVPANRIRNSVQGVRAEAAVHRTEQRYHNLVDTAPIPIVLFNQDGRAVYSNEAAVAFLDADSHAEIEGKSFAGFLHPEDRDTARARFERLMAEGQSMPEREFRVQTFDGECICARVATAHGYYHEEEVAQAMVYR